MSYPEGYSSRPPLTKEQTIAQIKEALVAMALDQLKEKHKEFCDTSGHTGTRYLLALPSASYIELTFENGVLRGIGRGLGFDIDPTEIYPYL